MEKFYTILTQLGENKLAEAITKGIKVQFSHLAFGDSSGVYYEPLKTATSLKNEVWRGQVNQVSTNSLNPNHINVEAGVPASDGGFTIREAGLFNPAGELLAIGKYPETEKPALESGSAKDLFVRMIIDVGSIEGVEYTLDPNVVIATKVDITNLEENLNININKKADSSELTYHKNDPTLHVTPQDKTKWDGAVTDLPNKADKVTMNNHITKREVHVTAAEKTLWNKGGTDIDTKADKTIVNTHLNNMDIHVTKADKILWNRGGENIAGKANLVHTHRKADVTDFPTKLSQFSGLGMTWGHLRSTGETTGDDVVNIIEELETRLNEALTQLETVRLATDTLTGKKYSWSLTLANGEPSFEFTEVTED